MSKGTNKDKSVVWFSITVLVIVLASVATMYCIKKQEQREAELQRQNDMVTKVYSMMEKQYFPTTGKVTAMYMNESGRLWMEFLNGTLEEYRAAGDMVYDTTLSYIDDDTYKLTATLDQLSSTHKEDYSFSCQVDVEGDDIILSDLKTTDPYPAFETSVMAKGPEKMAISNLSAKFFSDNWAYNNAQRTRRNSKRIFSSGSSTTNDTSTKSGSSGAKSGGSSGSGKKKTYNTEIDPSDYDIEQYYLDYQEEFENEEDAWDDFMDNPEYWDDY